MSVYDELLTELEDLAKAMPEADEKLEEEGEGHAEPDGDEDGGPGDGDGDEPMAKSDCDKPMAKSMSVTLPDGSEAEAIDGMELIKSFQGQLDANVEGVSKVLSKQAELIKSLTGTVEALRGDVATLRSEGRGRKTVVTMAGANPEPMAKSLSTPSDILAKCLDAQKAGKLTALDVSVAEGYLNRGMQIPDRIVSVIS